MNRAPAILCLLCLAFGGAAAAQEGDFEVDVFPQAINLGSEGKWLTVHANTPFDEEYEDEAFLDVVACDDYTTSGAAQGVMVLSDLNGNLVVKFRMAEVKDLVFDFPDGAEVKFYLCLWEDDAWKFGTDEVLLLNEGY